MARQRLRKRVFKALKEGWKRGYSPVHGTEVIGKPLEGRVVLPAQADGESVRDFVDGGLRSGRIPTEKWGLEDGRQT